MKWLDDLVRFLHHQLALMPTNWQCTKTSQADLPMLATWTARPLGEIPEDVGLQEDTQPADRQPSLRSKIWKPLVTFWNEKRRRSRKPNRWSPLTKCPKKPRPPWCLFECKRTEWHRPKKWFSKLELGQSYIDCLVLAVFSTNLCCMFLWRKSRCETNSQTTTIKSSRLTASPVLS